MVVSDKYLRLNDQSEFGVQVVKESRILSQVNCSYNGEIVGTITASCSDRGVCMSDGNCYCAPHYTTHNSDVGCNYERKSRLGAFAWHVFFGWEFGAGEWYLGNNDYATFELVLVIPAAIAFSILFGCFGMCAGAGEDLANDDNGYRQCGKIWGSLCAIAMFGFWGYELWAIATGTRLDGNGVRTY
jgi:hypothetical protein